jgi:hypothetical protein
MKKIISAVTAFVMMFSSVSCGKNKTSDSSDKDSKSTSVFSSAEPETTTAPPLMPPMSKPVECLSGFDIKASVDRMCCGADHTVAVQCYEYNGCYIYVFDPVTNSMVRKMKVDPSERLIGMFSDGTIVTTSPSVHSSFNLYASGSDEPTFMTADGADYYTEWKLDRENDCIYWIASNQDVMKIDQKGNVSKQLSGKGFTYIYMAFPEVMTIYASEASDEFENGVKEGIYSLADGSLITEYNDDAGYYECFSKDSFLNMVNIVGDVITESGVEIHVRDLSGNSSTKAYRTDEIGMNLFADHDSSHALLISFNPGMYGDLNEIYMLDPQTGGIAATGISSEEGASYAYCCYIKELGRWMICIEYGESNDENVHSKLFMVDPEMLDYSHKLEKVKYREPEKYEPVKVGAGFKRERELADEIEKEFGVRILVGNEVVNAETGSDYKFVSTEEFAYIDPDGEYNHLLELRKILAMYPKGFFEHFKSSNGNCGLRISLVEELQNTGQGAFVAGGVAYKTAGWYNIAVLSREVGLSLPTLHHEIWHCVETLVSKNYGIIDEDEWMKFNPAGFRYTDDLDGYARMTGSDYDSITSFEYEERTNYDSPHFASFYSMVTPMEDRATIVEKMFGTYYDENGKNRRYGSEGLKRFPHVGAKIDFLAEWAKQEFGYVYWDEMDCTEFDKAVLGN